jgi:asparagine synthase (glutamine-hydrolysing)
VLNGEIYNFQAIQTELKHLGHNFRTRSDSEVIAHAYEEWGPECVQRLQGMFAFAVWDRKNGKLFIARDRLGIKPLYYHLSKVQSPKSKVEGLNESAPIENETRAGNTDVGRGTLDFGPDSFLFASEVRTLLASGLVPRRLSQAALESYLLFGSLSEPMTLVEGVLSLPPGHSLTIDIGNPKASLKIEPYWTITSAANERAENRRAANGRSENGHAAATESASAAPARVRELLEESVRLHLIADVPIGVFLSSGIDSTSLAALAVREVKDVRTFTVAFNEQEFSEAAIARASAKQLGTRHDELTIAADEMLSRLDEAVGALDQPSIDGINSYFVSEAARQSGLKVALSGLGGDELFGGYQSTFRRTPRYQQLAAVSDQVPGVLRTAVGAAVSRAGQHLSRGDASQKLAALWNDSRSLPHPYYFARALFPPPHVGRLLKQSVTNGNGDKASPWWSWLSDTVTQVSELDQFTAVSCLEARSYMVSTLLRDTDAMSMAHSLEVRVPFLHHPLVEYVTQLPESVKIGDGSPKALLVRAMGELLPKEVVRQPKRGFTFPWQEWLRGPLRKSVELSLNSLTPVLAQVLNQREVSSVWQSYLHSKTSWSRPWSLYVLNEWVRHHL